MLPHKGEDGGLLTIREVPALIWRPRSRRGIAELQTLSPPETGRIRQAMAGSSFQSRRAAAGRPSIGSISGAQYQTDAPAGARPGEPSAVPRYLRLRLPRVEFRGTADG